MIILYIGFDSLTDLASGSTSSVSTILEEQNGPFDSERILMPREIALAFKICDIFIGGKSVLKYLKEPMIIGNEIAWVALRLNFCAMAGIEMKFKVENTSPHAKRFRAVIEGKIQKDYLKCLS